MLALNHHSKENLQQNLAGSIAEQSAKSQDWFLRLFIKNSDSSTAVENAVVEKTSFLTRITPFLLFSTFLMGFFPYLMITHEAAVQTDRIIALLFPFTVGTIFYFDNFLWNYYKGKKLALIWIIEIAIASFFLALSVFI